MARKTVEETYPRKIKVGSVTVTIYRVKHANTGRGFLYTVAWVGADRKRNTIQFADPKRAEDEARLKAGQLAAGQVAAAEMGREDRELLLVIREKCGAIPPLAALDEWAEARRITGGQVLPAAKAWAALNGKKGYKSILVPQCVEEFIAARAAAGADAERTYRAKLKPLQQHFKDRVLDSISTIEWTAYLSRWLDGVSRNDMRKRAASMCLWARKQGYLPRGVDLEISMTEKAREKEPAVGIIEPETYGKLLRYVRHYHPHHLAALVLAGFAGVRSDEIHGKRDDSRSKRQTWESIRYLDEEPIMTVDVAKRNTPSWRTVPLVAAAVEWLRLCPTPHEGPICKPAAMERIRDIGTTAGLVLPENCFRHSYISFLVIQCEDKPKVAMRAGTSVTRIDKNYRRPVLAETGNPLDCARPLPVTKKMADAWFSMTPAAAESLKHLSPPPAELQSRMGVNSSCAGEANPPAQTPGI